jgi:hypothetical protein
MLESLEAAAPQCETLLVAGGAAMMDEAKYFRASERPHMRLVLAPTLWGSGAERSPIVVLNRDGRKRIENGREFLPDEVVYWPEVLRTIPAERARRHAVDLAAVQRVLEELHEPASYRDALPLLRRNWMTVLRDPCTRTNAALVRPRHLEFFEEWGKP